MEEAEAAPLVEGAGVEAKVTAKVEAEVKMKVKAEAEAKEQAEAEVVMVASVPIVAGSLTDAVVVAKAMAVAKRVQGLTMRTAIEHPEAALGTRRWPHLPVVPRACAQLRLNCDRLHGVHG